MKKTFHLDNFEQLRAIADPLRRRLLEIFCKEPITTKQAAAILDEKPTKLYHHVDALEKAGLIKLVSTRQNRGTVEKYYQSVARTFAVDRNLLSNASPGAKNEVANLLVSTLEDSLKNLSESLDKGLLGEMDEKSAASSVNGKFYLNKAKLSELNKLIQNWLKENACVSAPDKTAHQLTLVLYPIEEKKESM